MVPNVDTDGDLLAVPPSSDSPGSGADAPAAVASSWADFPEVSSRELGETARRIVDALSHRPDETASTQLQNLYESLGAVLGRPTGTVGPDGWPEVADPTPSTPTPRSDLERP